MSETKKLLIVAHAPSDNTRRLRDAALAGARHEDIAGIAVEAKSPFDTVPDDVLRTDAILLGTTENLGYMSGALKHFFDTIYYPCLDATARRPYACYVHGNNDTAGAVRSIEAATTGLRWVLAQSPLEIVGPPTKADLDSAWELGAALTARLTLDPP